MQISVVDLFLPFPQKMLHCRRCGRRLSLSCELEIQAIPVVVESLKVEFNLGFGTAGDPVVAKFRKSVFFTGKKFVNVTFFKEVPQLLFRRC